jgi:hypothetical protein
VAASSCEELDAWHIATAENLFEAVGEPGGKSVFTTRDREQGEVPAAMGFEVI